MADPVPSRIAIVLDDGLVSWQRLNVTAFLASGIAAQSRQLVGEPYRDGSGAGYCPMFIHPVIVYQAARADLARLLAGARAQGLVPALFTTELFFTGNDHDNRAAVAQFATEELTLVGLGLAGPRPAMNKLLAGLSKHP
ncbi:MAG TPA: DUF2000 domain-containing protein [Candidatus Didemnitutus sp.]|nr:DUF2000 domain-containing protein [Candidatus Didemnitutus sp.]